MKLVTIIFSVLFLYSVAGTIDTWVLEAESGADAPLQSWNEWADVGCTEESRATDPEFDTLCRNWEVSQEAQELTDSSLGCTDDCLDSDGKFIFPLSEGSDEPDTEPEFTFYSVLSRQGE